MKKTLLICGVLLAFAVPAFAQPWSPGVDLHWTDCVLSGGVTDMANTCTANTGTVGAITCSFVPPGLLPLYEANLCLLDLQTSAATLSPWWHMETGGCPNRVGRITTSASWSNTACQDFWQLGATTAILYTTPSPGLLTPNSARIKAVAGVAEASAGPVDNIDNTTVPPTPLMWYALNVNIAKNGTLPASVCGGCLDGACIVLNEMFLSQPAPVPDVHLSIPSGAPGSANYVTYRGGAATHGGQCPGDPPTPTHKTTWGSVKSLYR